MAVLLDWLTRPFTYWYNFILEIRVWLIFQYTAKKSRKELEENNLRVDWIGRVYGVVNIPDEVLGAAEEVQQAYVLKELGQFGNIMKRLKLDNVVYPAIEPILGAGAYLVVFWPILDRLNLLNILGHVLYTALYVFISYLIIRAFIVYGIIQAIGSFITHLL
tara:strand:+ start:634 stop:1119 length:486 start_codon:yes stop_codon:yes gene_type:complete